MPRASPSLRCASDDGLALVVAFLDPLVPGRLQRLRPSAESACSRRSSFANRVDGRGVRVVELATLGGGVGVGRLCVFDVLDVLLQSERASRFSSPTLVTSKLSTIPSVRGSKVAVAKLPSVRSSLSREARKKSPSSFFSEEPEHPAANATTAQRARVPSSSAVA